MGSTTSRTDDALRATRGWRVVAGVAVAACAFLAAAAAGAAGPPLPQRNLVVEARVTESSASERQAIGGGGTVVIGSGGSTVRSGDFTVRAGSDSNRSDSVQRVLVLNGGRATVRLSQWLPLRTAEWVWAGRGLGAGVSTVWVDVGQGLAVRPSWQAGSSVAVAEVAVESAGRQDPSVVRDRSWSGSPDASVPRLALSTELALPLGEWVTVAQLFDDNSDSARGMGGRPGVGGVGASTRSLRREHQVQLRITVP